MERPMKTCPRCGLLNPEDGTVCACGFDLVRGDPASVRGGLRRRGRLCQVGGFLLTIFGLAGGTGFLPIHASFFFYIGSYRMDVPVVVAGIVLFGYGTRLVDRPWTEQVKRSAG
jgi:hypothetical protein